MRSPALSFLFVLLLALAGPATPQQLPYDQATLQAYGEANDVVRAVYDGGDKARGTRLFEEEVARGNPVSKLTLGWLLINSPDIPVRDPARGFRLWEEAAAAGEIGRAHV